MVGMQGRLRKMKLITSAVIVAAFVAAFVPVSVAERNAAVENNLRRDVEILASRKMGGRLAGSQEGRLAVAHIASEFKKAGLIPAPGLKDYYQSLSFTTSVALNPGNSLALKLKDAQPKGLPDRDFLPVSFSDDCDLKDVGVVFAGFGIRSKEPARDDFGSLDVKGKAVIVLRGGPDGEDPKSKYAAYHATRYKASIAKELGAVALLVAGFSSESDDLPKQRTGAVAGSAGLPVISIKRSLLAFRDIPMPANRLLHFAL
jgi:aminopeptidase YwaD